MKKNHLLSTFILASFSMMLLSGCNNNNSSSDLSPVTDTVITEPEILGDFSITGGNYTQSGTTYTISEAGEYTLIGALTGQVIIDAGENEVILNLSGTSITCDSDSPLKIVSAGDVEISAKSGTDNVIKDTRSAKTADNNNVGEGAINSKTDLKLKGTGTLVVTGNYNNGIHCTNDLTIQKLSLKVTARNNAIKGKDSITIKSGLIVAISTHGDGLKTENTDTNKNGVTRGDITFSGGKTYVYAAGDAISSAHNFYSNADTDGNTPTIYVYTGSYSGYTASDASVTSYKGVKAENLVQINAGQLDFKTYDDGLHANYGTTFESGETGLGSIEINGGSFTTSVYSPEAKTGGGHMGPGGWGGQTSVSGADALHADYKLTITDGIVEIDSAYEGMEANAITISGGSISIKANDDGINACTGPNKTPTINITGGYLDITVSTSGDTDGIDSNGSYTQSGGVVIVKGPGSASSSSNPSASIDCDGSIAVNDGTLIIFGGVEGRITKGSGVTLTTCSTSTVSAGSHTVSFSSASYTTTLTNSSSGCLVYSALGTASLK